MRPLSTIHSLELQLINSLQAFILRLFKWGYSEAHYVSIHVICQACQLLMGINWLDLRAVN